MFQHCPQLKPLLQIVCSVRRLTLLCLALAVGQMTVEAASESRTRLDHPCLNRRRQSFRAEYRCWRTHQSARECLRSGGVR